MAYTWTNGEVITADKLNSMGGVDLVVTIPNTGNPTVVGKSFSELYAATDARAKFVFSDSDGTTTYYTGEFHVTQSSDINYRRVLFTAVSYNNFESHNIYHSISINGDNYIDLYVNFDGSGGTYTYDSQTGEYTITWDAP